MRPVSWLHISDLHLREGSEWAQDVVLAEMRRNIELQRNDGATFDFILVTGDIAFSGKEAEYALAEQFFKDLESTSGVQRDHIFSVPGNHDIDRSQQKMAFRGTRSSLHDQISIDNFLTDKSELEGILKRQHAYRNFQKSFFADQSRQYTADGLAYISRLQIDDVSLAIVGLDSSWLSEGGESDYGKLLVGEMQVMNAMNFVLESDDVPHVVIAIAHHPFHVLQEFDLLSIRPHVENVAHFFHHGHLHRAATRMAGHQVTQCLTVAAGASYTTRHDFNAYSLITLDLMCARRSVESFFYDPNVSKYSLTENQKVFPIEIKSSSHCSVSELAEAIRRYDPEFEHEFYFSALVLGQKNDFPVPNNGPAVFASLSVVQASPASELKDLADNLVVFGNILRALYGRDQLDGILTSHGAVLGQFKKVLAQECMHVPNLTDRLSDLNNDARIVAGIEPGKPFQHTHDLFKELSEQKEWYLLNEQAKSHLESDDESLALQAKRMCAIALLNLGGSENKTIAIEYYRELVTSEAVEFSDVCNFVISLSDVGRMDEAVRALFAGMRDFPANKKALHDIGQKIVAATGDRQLRKKLEQESSV